MTAPIRQPATSPTVDASRARRSRDESRDVWLVSVLFVLVPVSFVTITVGGRQLTGLAWLVVLLLTTPFALSEPVPAAVVRRLWPYLGFLAVGALSLAWAPVLSEAVLGLLQYLTLVPVFLIASRLSDPTRALAVAGRVCTAGIALAAALVVADRAGLMPAAVPLSPRPMAVALVPLFVVATLRATRTRTAVLSVAVLAPTVLAGSRTAAVVLLAVVLLSPAWRFTARGRIALGLVALVGLLAFSTTTAFRERFFFDSDATLGDALTGSEVLNTAGRRELWPQLVGECSRASLTGLGIQAAGELSADFSLGALTQPHNDYLRIWCEVGWVGMVPFWGFFVAAAVAGARARGSAGPEGAAVVQVITALLLLAVTDNPVIYTVHFMAPVAVVLGCARASSRQEQAL